MSIRKRLTALLIVSCAICALLCACEPEKPAITTEYVNDAQRREQLAHDAELRKSLPPMENKENIAVLDSYINNDERTAEEGDCMYANDTR